MANWTVKINTPSNNAGPNAGPGQAKKNRNQPTSRSADESDDVAEEIREGENMDAARAAVELEKEKAFSRKENRSSDMAAEANQIPQNEFATLGHGDIGGREGPEPAQKEEAPPAEQPEEEGGVPETPAAQGGGAPQAADQARQQQAQQQGLFARMLMRQKQAAMQKMRPIDQKIKTEQKQVDEVNSAIKKNDAKISSAKTIQRLGCCVMIIPGLGWIVGIIIRILTTKSKVEARKAEAENWAKKGKLAELKAKIAKLKKQRQKLAKQAGGAK